MKTFEVTKDMIKDYQPEKPISDEEAEKIARELDEKIKENKRSIFNILAHLKALKRYMLDKDVRWIRKSVVIAAIIYFITPVDLMPDVAPIVGFLDDIGIISWTIRFLGREIKNYY
ncbi:MAG: YkvA family protein [Ignavibacteria bacterium]|nr:YkvA family protein [Ignavibacteria bacterium]